MINNGTVFVTGLMFGILAGMLLSQFMHGLSYREEAIKCIEAGHSWNTHYNHCFKKGVL